MASLASIQPTTELEAVNELLAAIGEAPISNLITSNRNDVDMAVDALRATSRTVQLDGWRFNTELGLELVPDSTYSWTDTDGDTTTLNVWEKPSGLGEWRITPDQGQFDLDIIIRPSKQYAGGGTLIFYDRELNRDGLDSDDYESLYIDAVWLFDFDEIPQAARNYITRLAAFRFVGDVSGSEKLSKFATDDVIRARRALIRSEGAEGSVNLFDTPEASKIFGKRPVAIRWPNSDSSSPTYQ